MSDTSVQAYSSPPQSGRVPQTSENIFSSLTQRSQRSQRSERRYARSPGVLAGDAEGENKENMPVVETQVPSRRRRSSHFRKPSVYIPMNQRAEDVIAQVASLSHKPSSISTNSMGHKKRISDADSVMLGQDESFTSKQRLSVDSLENSSEVATSKESTLRNSVPILGIQPRNCYCKFCKVQVLTHLGFSSLVVPTGLLGAIASLFNCWKGPQWLSEMRVHTCPHCKLVLGRSR